jgi:hypothetical protein
MNLLLYEQQENSEKAKNKPVLDYRARTLFFENEKDDKKLKKDIADIMN